MTAAVIRLSALIALVGIFIVTLTGCKLGSEMSERSSEQDSAKIHGEGESHVDRTFAQLLATHSGPEFTSFWASEFRRAQGESST